MWGPIQVVFYNKLSWLVSELPEKDISNVVVQCRQYSTISCRGLYLNYLKKISQMWGPIQVVFYNKLSWLVSELPEKDISNVVVQCRQYSTISCRGLYLNYLKKISQMWGPIQVVFYNKLSWLVFELPKKDISNVVVQCRQYSTISCRGSCLNYLKKISQMWGPIQVVFYNKLSWLVSELPEKDISNVVVQCRQYSTISCRGSCLNNLKKISQMWGPIQVVFYNKLSWLVSELPEKDISNVVVQCRQYSTISCRGLYLNYLKKISQMWGPIQVVFYNKLSWLVSELPEKDISNVVVQCRQYSTISCRGLYLNYLKKISQMWGPIQVVFYNKLSWLVFELPKKDISNVVVQCRQYSTISCRGSCLNYLKKISQMWGPIQVVFYNKLSWLVSELPEKDISNVVVQCRQYSTISCRGSCLNNLKKISQMWGPIQVVFYNKLSWLVSELPEKDISNVVVQCRQYSTISCRGLYLNYLKKISQMWGPIQVVFYNKLSWLVSELPEKDISNVVVQCRQYSTISCRGLYLNYLKKISQMWGPIQVVFYNKLSWLVFELPKKDISNVVVQCRQYSTISCRGSCLNNLKKISQMWGPIQVVFYNKLSWLVSELPEKDISNVVVQCRQYSTISCRGLYLNYLKKISQMWGPIQVVFYNKLSWLVSELPEKDISNVVVQCRQYSTISCRGLYLNYLKKISQMWGPIQVVFYNKLSWLVFELPKKDISNVVVQCRQYSTISCRGSCLNYLKKISQMWGPIQVVFYNKLSWLVSELPEKDISNVVVQCRQYSTISCRGLYLNYLKKISQMWGPIQVVFYNKLSWLVSELPEKDISNVVVQCRQYSTISCRGLYLNYLKKISQMWGPIQVVFYNKLSWLVFELPKKDISNVVVQCRQYSTISCRGSCLNYLKKISQMWGPIQVVFYNKLSWLVSELPEKDISNVVVQCRQYSTISCRGLYLNYLKKISQMWGPIQVVFYNKLSWLVSELPEKDISNVVVQCRQHSTISGRGMYLNYLKKISQMWGPIQVVFYNKLSWLVFELPEKDISNVVVQCRQYSTISCRGSCLNNLKKISQMWGPIQVVFYNKLSWLVSELPEKDISNVVVQCRQYSTISCRGLYLNYLKKISQMWGPIQVVFYNKLSWLVSELPEKDISNVVVQCRQYSTINCRGLYLNYLKKISQMWGPIQVVFYNKLSWLVFELPEKDISNVVVQCRQYSTISCRGSCLNYLKKISQMWGPIQVVFYNKLSWLVSELPEKDISNVVVQCRQYSTISCRGLYLNYLKKISQMWGPIQVVFYNKLSWLVSELPEKDISNVVVQCRQYSTINCRGLYLNYLKKISQMWGPIQVVFYNKLSWLVFELPEKDISNVVVQCRQYSTISCRGSCLNYLKKISQMWGPIQVVFYNKLSWLVSELPEKDISNVVVQCRQYSTISCRGLYLNYLKKISQMWGPIQVVFYNKLSWLVSELPEKDISNVVVQCRQYSTINCRGLYLNYLKKISQMWGPIQVVFYNKLSWLVFELPEKDISNVVVQCRQYSTISCRGSCLNNLKKISQMWGPIQVVFYNKLSWLVFELPKKDISNVVVQCRQYSTISCRGSCLNYLKKISQMWGPIQVVFYNKLSWLVSELPEKDISNVVVQCRQYSTISCRGLYLNYLKKISQMWGPIQVVFYNKLSWLVSELPEKDISNVVVQCRQYSTISGRGMYLNYLKKISQMWGPIQVVFYNKLSWLVFELPEKDISNVVVQCRQYSTISCRGSCLNNLKKISQMWGPIQVVFYNKLSWLVSELPEKDISNVVVQCRQYSTISCRGLYLNYLKKISQMWGPIQVVFYNKLSWLVSELPEKDISNVVVQCRQYSTINCRGLYLNYLKKISQMWGPIQVVFYNKLSWLVFELPEKDISNVVVQCRQYSTISCRGSCLNYLKKISQMWGPIQVVFYNKLSWLVSELPEKDISNVVVQCRQYSTISCRGLYLNYLKKISQMWGPIQVVFYNKLSWLVSELPEKDISNVVVQCRQYSTINCRGLYLNYLKKISQMWGPIQVVFYNKLSWLVFELPEKDISNVVVQCRQYSTISCRGSCLNYLKKISQMWGPIQVVFYNKLSWLVSELPEKDISNVVVQCRQYSTISCRGLYLNYLKKISQMWGPIQVVFYNKLSWLVSELPEKDISNVVVQCRQYSTINCRGLYLNYLKKISQMWGPIQVVFYNKLSWLVFELPEKDISNVVVQCRQYSTISCRGSCLNYMKKIS